MKKETFMTLAQTKEDKLLIAYVLDRIALAEDKYTPGYTYFLNAREQVIAGQILRSFANLPHLLWGGNEACERRMLGIAPEYGQLAEQEFPLSALKITSRELDRLSHRDFLGALMGLGIKRERVGDILITEQACYLFVCEDISVYIKQNMTKVGSAGVHLQRCQGEQIDYQRRFLSLRATISSARIDTVVAHLTNLARGKAEQLIASGRVQIDHFDVMDKNAPVSEGAAISIKGYGRYQIDQIGPPTKKGRLVFLARKFV